MKKTLFCIILTIAVLMLAASIIPRPTHIGMTLAPMPETPKKEIPEKSADLEHELKYYFDRHNVQDEGYEMVVAVSEGKRLEIDIPVITSARNVGTWRNHARNGTSVILDSVGRTIVALCHADTLISGIRADSAGTFYGNFHGNVTQGHGAYYETDGSYYEGHWEQDRRQGFGIELSQPYQEDVRLRVGEWSKDKFQGERMLYTSERVYGIDIAKYQHGKRRRALPIHWKKLRITHVGKKGSNNVTGVVDYPVSFVYIKSTEGISIRNRFYLGDYTQARKHGFVAGAYHFFSVRSSGAAQARYFIKNTLFRKGDLPPVLDIEPSDAQIRQMGGADAMFRHIRTWLRTVESWTGVKPILYVNQRFVNKYLSEQPDLKRDYRIWIARYSEYKPDVKLTYWQLCPDGRVAGIRGDVDINVFNGYKSQFEEFLLKETIR